MSSSIEALLARNGIDPVDDPGTYDIDADDDLFEAQAPRDGRAGRKGEAEDVGDDEVDDDADEVRRASREEARDAVSAALNLLDPDALTELSPSENPDSDDDAPLLEGAAGIEPIVRPNGQTYHPRLLGSLPDVAALRACRNAGIHVLMSGRPGTGKTAALEAAFGDELVTFEGHGDAEIGDLVGTYTQQPDGTYLWVDGPLVVAMKQGHILFVDDATLTPTGVLARLYPAMDGRQTIRLREHAGETITAADGFLVVGAHNPGVPGAVLSEALASRFLLQIRVATDLKLARELGVDHRIVRIAAALSRLADAGELSWAPEMRELLAYQQVAEALGTRVAIANLVGLAPEEDHDSITSVVRSWFPDAVPLAVGARATGPSADR